MWTEGSLDETFRSLKANRPTSATGQGDMVGLWQVGLNSGRPHPVNGCFLREAFS